MSFLAAGTGPSLDVTRLVMFLHGRSRTFNLATRSTGLGFESDEILYQELIFGYQMSRDVTLCKLAASCSKAAPTLLYCT